MPVVDGAVPERRLRGPSLPVEPSLSESRILCMVEETGYWQGEEQAIQI